MVPKIICIFFLQIQFNLIDPARKIKMVTITKVDINKRVY